MLSSQPPFFSSRLPGPKGLPFLGNLLQIDVHKLYLILEDWVGRYGDMFQIRLANKPVAVISNPEPIQTILRERPHHYRHVNPFGAGPRFCPGRSLALLEIKMAMAMVFRNFTVARHA